MAKILLVDDEAVPSRLLAELLESEGHRVTVVQRGDEVLGAVRTGVPELILMDLWLKAQDVDGLGLTRQLKGAPDTRAIPIIAVTAWGQERYEAALRAGCDGFHKKPVDAGQLLRLIREHLNREVPR